MDAVQSTVSGLAIAKLQETLDKGHPVSIPSLNIIVLPDRKINDPDCDFCHGDRSNLEGEPCPKCNKWEYMDSIGMSLSDFL